MDDVQWFRLFGKCSQPGCDKDSIGTLMNSVNASMGLYCRIHGEARLKKAKAEREKGEQK